MNEITKVTELNNIENRTRENVAEFKKELASTEFMDDKKSLMALARSKDIIESDYAKRHQQLNKITSEADVLLERAKLAGFTKDNITDVADESIEKLFKSTDDTEEIVLEVAIDDPKRALEFKRSFIGMLLVNDEADQIYKEQMEKLNKEIAEDMEEFKKVVNQYGDYNSYIRAELEHNIAHVKDENERKRQETLLRYLDFSETSENILEAVKKANRLNILSDFRNDQKQIDMYGRYLKLVKKMKLNVDLTKFGNVELQIPGYETYANLFVFTVMRTIAYEKDASQVQGFYLANLGMVLQEFLAGTLSEERRERFIAGVKAVIDYVNGNPS